MNNCFIAFGHFLYWFFFTCSYTFQILIPCYICYKSFLLSLLLLFQSRCWYCSEVLFLKWVYFNLSVFFFPLYDFWIQIYSIKVLSMLFERPMLIEDIPSKCPWKCPVFLPQKMTGKNKYSIVELSEIQSTVRKSTARPFNNQ